MVWRYWDIDCKCVGLDRDKKLDNLDRECKIRGEIEQRKSICYVVLEIVLW